MILKPANRGFVIEDSNDEFIHVTGAKKEELVGLDLAEVFNAIDYSCNFNRQEIENSIAHSFASRTKVKIEGVKQKIKDPDPGEPQEKFWQVEIIPFPGEGDGEIVVVFKEIMKMETPKVSNNSESRFTSLVKEGSNLIAILDSNGIYKCVSETSVSVLGFKPEYFNNKSTFDFIHPEDKDRVVSVFSNLPHNKPVKIDKYRFKNNTGEWRWFESQVTDFRGNPKVDGIVVNSRVITQKEQFKGAIDDIEKKYEALYKHSVDGILLTRPPGEILAANPAARKMFQMTEEELQMVGRPGIVDTEDPSIREAIRKRESHGAIVGEIIMKKKDGSKFPVELSSAIFKDAKGELYTSMILRDITEKKIAEEKLKASQQKYELMFRQNPIPNWIYNRRTLKILDVNEAAIAHYGYSKEEFLQLKITDLRPVEEMPKLFSAIDKWKDAEGVVKFGTTVHLKKDGKPIHVEISGYHLTYDGQDCSRVISNDITEKEEILQKLESNRAKLLTAQRIAKLGYWERNLKTNEILWTDEVYKIWGREKETFVPTLEKIFASIHPEDLEIFKKEINIAEKGGKEADVDFRIFLQDSSMKWINGKGKVAVDKFRKPFHYEGTFQDITENKINHEKLRLNEIRHRGILNSQTNYLVRTDLAGNLTYGNKKFLKDFKWINKGNNHRKFLASVHEEHHERVIDCFKTCLKYPNKVYQVEMDQLREGSQIVHTLWEFVCLADSNGNRIEVQCVGIDISERVKAEKLLKESNERYDLVSRATQDAIYDWDCVSEEIIWNEGYYTVFGDYGKDSAPGTMNTWVNSIHPEDRGIVEAMYTALRGTQTNWQVEYRIQKPNGEHAYVLGRGFIVRDENQEAVRMVGAIRDITEKKKLEELLDRASRLAKIGSFEVNLLQDTVYWSPVTKEIHEVEPDFKVTMESGTAFYKIGESLDKVNEALEKAVEENIPYDIEVRIKTAKGNERWVRIIGRPEFVDGKCVRISGSFQDIDSIKRTQLEAVVASEEKQVILESIGDAFFAVNNEWTVTYFNKHAEALLECDKDEVLEKNLWETFPDAVDTDFYNFYQVAMAEKKVQNFEEYFDRVNRWFDVSAYPSENGLSVYLRDITDRKKAHIELLKLNEDLSIYTKELVSANKSLEQFTYIVSHNLRSPVANILGLANLLEDGEYPPEVREELFQELFDNVKRLDTVIRDLNLILQLKHEINLKKEKVELEGVVFSIKEAISPLVQKEQVQIITNFSKVPEIRTVSTYIYSIFYNLIHNSIKYRRANVPVVIELNSDRKNGEIIFKFQDNGLGIDMKRRKDQLFGLYKRFHDHVDGKGMGLFMVKTQVEILGGKIEVNSEVDKELSLSSALRIQHFRTSVYKCFI